MPQLHTDDGPRRLRAVWLGPTGATLPFEWTYVQWTATLAAIPVTVGLLWGLGTLVHQFVPAYDSFLVWAIALVWGPAVGVYATVRVMRHVSFDQPLSARARLVRAELRPRPTPHPAEMVSSPPPISELAGPVGHEPGVDRPGAPVPGRPAVAGHPPADRSLLWSQVMTLTTPRRAVPRWQSLGRRLSALQTPRQVSLKLATAAVAGPLQFTSAGVFCWFELGPQNWDFKTHTERVNLWDQVAYRLGALTNTVPTDVEGRPIRLRVTTRPYPAFEFARALDEASPHRLPDVAEETWDRYLEHAQKRLQSTGLDQKLVAVGVWVCPPVSKQVMAELVGGTEHPDLATVKVLNEVATVTRIMAGPGFDAHPLTGRDMAFLFHRSLSMGTPVPAAAGVGASRWEPDELAAATQRCAWTAEPFGTTVTVHTERNGHALDRHVAVVSLGSMPEQTWPENGREPWMLALDAMPFGVEWSLNGTLLRPSVLEGTLAREQLRAEAIRRHYQEHRLTPPPVVDRAIHAATVNLDQVTEGDVRAAARFLGTVRVATFADTREQAIEQASRIVARLGERFHIEAAHVLGQPAQLREFIPGEPRVKEGFQRRLPIKYLAAGLPNVGADLGTPAGPYVGYGSGSARRAVCFDMHFGPEVLNTPGLFTISAEPGAGNVRRQPHPQHVEHQLLALRLRATQGPAPLRGVHRPVRVPERVRLRLGNQLVRRQRARLGRRSSFRANGANSGRSHSVLIGTLAYNAARAGEPTIILDPSGPLAAGGQAPGRALPHRLARGPLRDGGQEDVGRRPRRAPAVTDLVPEHERAPHRRAGGGPGARGTHAPWPVRGFGEAVPGEPVVVLRLVRAGRSTFRATR